MTEPHKTPDPQPRYYALPSSRNLPFFAQMALGFGAMIFTGLSVGVIFIVLQSNGLLTPELRWAVYAVAAGLLLILALVTLIRYRWPGVVAGIFTGLLIIGLIIGGLFLLLVSMCRSFG